VFLENFFIGRLPAIAKIYCPAIDLKELITRNSEKKQKVVIQLTRNSKNI